MAKKRKKQVKRQIPQKKLWLRLALYSLIGLLCFPLILVFSIKTGIIGKLPNESQIENIQNFEASEVYSSDGKLLGRYFIQNRTVLDYEVISPHLINALISTEDVRFFEHNGIDARSLMRVFFKTLLLGDRSAGGGSTITQQLAKNVFHRQNYPYLSMVITKIREMLIAVEIEDHYSKEQILAMYLNTVPFGENVYGVEAASQRFFQESASNLSVQEAALLVGMLKATSYYNPRNNPESALQRRNVVLSQMEKAQMITRESMDSLCKLPIELNYVKADENEGLATYFREEVRKQLQSLLPSISDSLGESYNLYTDGLKIYTTLDSRLQTYAENAVYRQMRSLQKTFDEHWKGMEKPWESEEILDLALNQSTTYSELKNQHISRDSIFQRVSQKRMIDVYSWDGKESLEMSTLDSIKFYLRFLNCGFLSMDPVTGEIKAWVGGINYRYFKYDHVHEQAKRQVGSIFKPIVYAAALEQNVSPCQYIKADQETYREEQEQWTPGNADNNYEGKYSMEGALTESVNTVAVKILGKAGIESTVALANDMGITSDIPKVPSIALGTPSISLFEMVTAYSSFVNKGQKPDPVMITRIENKEGETIWKHPGFRTEQVLTMSTSQIMIEMLKNVVNSGTGQRIRSTYRLENDIAGKTGTTQSNADGWFMAMTPHLVTGVWVGGEYPSIHFRTTALGQGANMALPIYALFQQQINKDPRFTTISNAQFPAPPREVAHQLDCDPFKDDATFWEWLFGSREDREKRRAERKDKSDESDTGNNDRGFLKGLKKLFKKKD